MATIIIVMLPEPGHLNPTYKLAKELKQRGRRVCYLSAPDYEAEIRSHGLEFIPFFTDAPPEAPFTANLPDGAECLLGGPLPFERLTDHQIGLVLAQRQKLNTLVEE